MNIPQYDADLNKDKNGIWTIGEWLSSVSKWLTNVVLRNSSGEELFTSSNPGAVTVNGSLVSSNNTLKVRDSFTAKEAKRVTLTPGSESTQTFTAAFEALQVLNYGPGDIYLDIDSAAAIGGADDVLVQEGTSIPIPVAGIAVHLIGSSASVVQLVGYRTPAA